MEASSFLFKEKGRKDGAPLVLVTVVIPHKAMWIETIQVYPMCAMIGELGFEHWRGVWWVWVHLGPPLIWSLCHCRRGYVGIGAYVKIHGYLEGWELFFPSLGIFMLSQSLVVISMEWFWLDIGAIFQLSYPFFILALNEFLGNHCFPKQYTPRFLGLLADPATF